jgi:hypothetical protein
VLDLYDSFMLKDMKSQTLMMEIENSEVNYGFYFELSKKKNLSSLLLHPLYRIIDYYKIKAQKQTCFIVLFLYIAINFGRQKDKMKYCKIGNLIKFTWQHNSRWLPQSLADY